MDSPRSYWPFPLLSQYRSLLSVVILLTPLVGPGSSSPPPKPLKTVLSTDELYMLVVFDVCEMNMSSYAPSVHPVSDSPATSTMLLKWALNSVHQAASFL